MYRLYLNTMSPFGAKSCAMIGYAGLPCEVKIQNIVSRFATIKRLTGKTMIPVLRRGEWAINDSSRIARFVQERTDRPLLPGDPALAPICWLLEDFADEWIALWMLASRWTHERDIEAMEEGVGKELTGGLPLVSSAVGRIAASGIQSLIEKGGAAEVNRAALERSRDRLLQALESLLETPPQYLFEAYPTMADFAFFGPLSQYASDPTGRDKMRMYPNVGEYLECMERMKLPHPSVSAHEAPSRDVGALAPLFAEFLGTYWRVLLANHRAYSTPERPQRTSVELLDGEAFSFRPSGYYVARLEFVLSQLDAAYAEREELFGGKALEIEHALVQEVAKLTDYEAGRELLRGYAHIGKPAK
jgi:glutathione S-transferase